MTYTENSQTAITQVHTEIKTAMARLWFRPTTAQAIDWFHHALIYAFRDGDTPQEAVRHALKTALGIEYYP